MALYEGDLKAGVTGLVLGVILLFAVTFSIVLLTNASHAKHPAPAAGAAPTHQPAPTQAPAQPSSAQPSPAQPAPGQPAPAQPSPAQPAPAGSP